MLDKGSAAGTCRSRRRLSSALEVQHIVWGSLYLDEENRNASIQLIGVSSLVPMSDSSKKVVTFPLVLVQHGLCDCSDAIDAPQKFHGVSKALQVHRNPECSAECDAQFCAYPDFRC